MGLVLDLRPLELDVWVPLGKHTQGLDRERELVVGVTNAAALVEHALDRLLLPLAVRLLTTGNERRTSPERLYVRVFGQHKPDQRPRRHDNLAAAGMLYITHLLA